MIDRANELRRHARKIPHPQGETPGVMLRAADEIECLRAKIEAMERQEPIAWMHETRRDSDVVTDAVKHVWGKVAVGSMAAYSIPLYTLPGAQTQPAPSIPDDVMRDAKRYRFLRAAKNIPISTEAARDPIVYDAAIDDAMLAAAPEAKQ